MFIKVIEAGTFFLTGEVYQDITPVPGGGTWQEDVSIDLFIDPTTPVGSFFQFGIQNNSTNSDPSGVFIDNLRITEAGGCVGNGTDTDGDGVDDNCDNCSATSNAAQVDSDGTVTVISAMATSKTTVQ